jgi:hypothetical protein
MGASPWGGRPRSGCLLARHGMTGQVVAGEAVGQDLHGARGPGGGAGAGTVCQAVPVVHQVRATARFTTGAVSRRVIADVVLGLRSSAFCNAAAPAIYCPNAASIASA